MKRLYIFLTGVGVSAAVLLGSLVFSSYFFEDFWRPACMVPGMGEMMRRGGVESGGPDC